MSDGETTDNQRETALQAYIDKMSELLLKENLRESAEDSEVRQIARVRTITILRRLGADRKGSVLQFLHEAGLIGAKVKDDYRVRSIISLYKANLCGANLGEAFLALADLSYTDLRGANLNQATLDAVNLDKTNLAEADLSESSMVAVSLREANLSGTNLRGADLTVSILTDAKGITTTELEKQAKPLKDARMPDGSMHS